MPIVSVIMGVYNAGNKPMLETSIGSILRQSFQDFELIICDDGSTDQTAAWLREFAARDRRIRLLTNEINLGLAATLNHCLHFAAGIYIARQDADDFSRADRLEKQARFLDRHAEFALLGSNVALFDGNGVWGRHCLPEYPGKKDFLFTSPFVHPATMMRKTALLAVRGYRVARETRRAEDYDLFMRMYAAGMRGANLPEQLYSYREDAAASSRRDYRFRMEDAVVRYKGFRAMGVFWRGVPYIVKPLVVGLVPAAVLRRMQNWFYGRKA